VQAFFLDLFAIFENQQESATNTRWDSGFRRNLKPKTAQPFGVVAVKRAERWRKRPVETVRPSETKFLRRLERYSADKEIPQAWNWIVRPPKRQADISWVATSSEFCCFFQLIAVEDSLSLSLLHAGRNFTGHWACKQSVLRSMQLFWSGAFGTSPNSFTKSQCGWLTGHSQATVRSFHFAWVWTAVSKVPSAN